MAKDKGTPSRGEAEAAISIIGTGMEIVGDLTTEGTVRVEGRVQGAVRAGKAVVLGKSGEISGELSTQDAVIGGRFEGTLTAESRLELQTTAVVEGEIRTRGQHLKLEEGAVFNGRVLMLDEDAALPDPDRSRPAVPSPPAPAPGEGHGEVRDGEAREGEARSPY